MKKLWHWLSGTFTMLEYWWWDAPRFIRARIITVIVFAWLAAIVALGAINTLMGMVFFLVTFIYYLAWISL